LLLDCPLYTEFSSGVCCWGLCYFLLFVSDNQEEPPVILQHKIADDSIPDYPDCTNYDYVPFHENPEVAMTSNIAYVQHVNTSPSMNSTKQLSRPLHSNGDNKVSMTTNTSYGINQPQTATGTPNHHMEKSEENNFYISIVA